MVQPWQAKMCSDPRVKHKRPEDITRQTHGAETHSFPDVPDIIARGER